MKRFESEFELVCSDGAVRHFPYWSESDALSDARVADRKGCRFYPTLTRMEKAAGACPGGRHRVRPKNVLDPEGFSSGEHIERSSSITEGVSR